MRGASALQELLRETSDDSLRVFVVWEPVIWSDVAPPLSIVLARVTDRRATQFWDRSRLVSADLLRGVRTRLGGPEDAAPGGEAIVWDAVAVYPPVARWEESLPAPDYLDGPVVAVIDEVRARLEESIDPAVR